MKTIILASESPRRKRLLEKTGLKFKVVKNNFKEYADIELKPDKLAQQLSLKKAKSVVPKFKNSLIIAADTLVVIGSKILGKPYTKERAREMLRTLSGKMHCVITGFTVYDTQKNKSITKSVKSRVYFNKISKKEIDNYVITKKPFDKAGAYGIQEIPKIFIKKIKGDYDNVVGLPTSSVVAELSKFDAF